MHLRISQLPHTTHVQENEEKFLNWNMMQWSMTISVVSTLFVPPYNVTWHLASKLNPLMIIAAICYVVLRHKRKLISPGDLHAPDTASFTPLKCSVIAAAGSEIGYGANKPIVSS
jgi:hypothetical protein